MQTFLLNHKINAVSAKPPAGQNWGIEALNVPDTWKVTKGKGIKVMVIDTGTSTDARMLDDYNELSTSLTWRTGGASPFSASNEDVNITKIGRFVYVRGKVTLTATTTTLGNEELYILGLPFASNLTGQISGQCWIQASGGGSIGSIINAVSPLYMNTNTSHYSILTNFSPISVGYEYTVSFEATYTTDT